MPCSEHQEASLLVLTLCLCDISLDHRSMQNDGPKPSNTSPYYSTHFWCPKIVAHMPSIFGIKAMIGVLRSPTLCLRWAKQVQGFLATEVRRLLHSFADCTSPGPWKCWRHMAFSCFCKFPQTGIRVPSMRMIYRTFRVNPYKNHIYIYGCFHKLGILFVGVLMIGALLFGVSLSAPKLPDPQPTLRHLAARSAALLGLAPRLHRYLLFVFCSLDRNYAM